MPAFHEFNDIDGCLKNIEFMNDSGFFTIRVAVGTNTYECNFDNVSLCCENFGISTYLGGDNYIDVGSKIENGIIAFNKIIGHRITSINVGENKGEGECKSMSVKFICQNTIIFTLEFYNWHNGYYPHNLYLNLCKGDSTVSKQMLMTCI